MKTNILILVLSVLCLFTLQSLHAQNGVNVIADPTYPIEIFAGNLPKPSAGENQKLRIDVFGGTWHNNNLGVTTYYIATRDGVLVNMERHGGDGAYFKLKIYDNGSSYDFIIAKAAVDFCAFSVEAKQIKFNWGITAMVPVPVASYDPTGKTDISSQFPVNTIFATSNNGNVGIGIDYARNKLDVNGTIRAKEVKVELTNWSDFVFSPDYKLPSLKEVESHILSNGHLPGIPSEKEVVSEGIDLGAMNTLLLQKIEELTLHLIHQEKRIAHLEGENGSNLVPENEPSK